MSGTSIYENNFAAVMGGAPERLRVYGLPHVGDEAVHLHPDGAAAMFQPGEGPLKCDRAVELKQGQYSGFFARPRPGCW